MVAIDCKQRQNPDGGLGWYVCVKGGRENAGLDAVTWAIDVVRGIVNIFMMR